MHDEIGTESEDLDVFDEADLELEEDEDPVKAENDILIDALARGATAAEAGRLIGRSARNVRWRRSKDPNWKPEEARRRGEYLARVAGRAIDMSHRALDTLVQALDDDLPAIRLRAAQIILGTASGLDRATDRDNQAAELKQIVVADIERRRQREEEDRDDDS